MQKPEPVAPLPLVQGSCHESFLLILSLSRLQLQWHTHEICGICFPPPVCQVRATAPHPSQEQSGTTGVVIMPLDIASALSLGEELQQEHHAPLPWWGGVTPKSHSPFLQYLSERSRQSCRWGPGQKAASQGGQAGSQCVVRISGSITQLKTSSLQLSSQKGANVPG